MRQFIECRYFRVIFISLLFLVNLVILNSFVSAASPTVIGSIPNQVAHNGR